LERLRTEWQLHYPDKTVGPHIVALGGTATKWLLGMKQDEGFERWVGTTLEVDLPEVDDD